MDITSIFSSAQNPLCHIEEPGAYRWNFITSFNQKESGHPAWVRGTLESLEPSLKARSDLVFFKYCAPHHISQNVTLIASSLRLSSSSCRDGQISPPRSYLDEKVEEEIDDSRSASAHLVSWEKCTLIECAATGRQLRRESR